MNQVLLITLVLLMLSGYYVANISGIPTWAFGMTTGLTAFALLASYRFAWASSLLQLALVGLLWTYLSCHTKHQEDFSLISTQNLYLWANFLLLQLGNLIAKKKSASLNVMTVLAIYCVAKITLPVIEPSGILALLLMLSQLLNYCALKKIRTHEGKNDFLASTVALTVVFMALAVMDLLNGPTLIVALILMIAMFWWRSNTGFYPKTMKFGAILNALFLVILINQASSPSLGTSKNSRSIPILYSPQYNISLGGIEYIHPFDSKKYERVYNKLRKKNIITGEQIISPGMPSKETLLLGHSEKYLEALKTSGILAKASELAFLTLLPDKIVHHAIGKPMLYATQGSVLAGELALKKKWAINLGGGYHHASANEGGGFCAYADISISIRHLMKQHPEVKKVMIIDLDAHQGNGHERDFMGDSNVFIVDIYNGSIYPQDEEAKKGADLKAEIPSYSNDALYLPLLKKTLEKAFSEFQPDIIYYNAGTDLLQNDPLGRLSVSSRGVVTRDEMVFGEALKRKIPIVMMLSGGYQKNNATVIAESIANLNEKYHLMTRDN